MKKLILTALLAAAAAIGMSAQETYYYTPAGNPTTAYKLSVMGSGDNAVSVKVGDQVVQMIQVPASLVSQLAGNEVSSVSFYSGLFYNPSNASAGYQTPAYRTVDIILTRGLNETPFYSETTSVPDGYLTQKTFKLTTPQPVEADKPLFVGVRVKIVDENDFYLPVDEAKTTAAYGNNFAYDEADVMANSADWNRTADQGNACIGVYFSGNSLPQDGVTFVDHETPVAVDLNTPFTVPVTVRGTAANKASNVTVSYRIGSVSGTCTADVLDPVTRQPKPIGQGETGVIEVSGITSAVPSTSSILYLTGSQVNGRANYTASTSTATLTFPTFVLADGFERIPVMEEATSVNCAWCPAGAALMTYLNEQHPGTFLTIGYHVDFSGYDPMTVASCQAWPNYYARSYPYGIFNRDVRANAQLGYISTLSGLAEVADTYYNRVRSANTYAGIELTADFTDAEKTAVKADTKVKFALDIPASDGYQISYVLTQDKMGPFRQSNNYAGREDDMGGWQNLPSRANVYHNHVARELVGFPGVENSVKAGMAKGEESTHSQTISLENVTGSRVKVVAMLVSSTSRQVMNAREVELRVTEDTPDFSEESGTFTDPFYLELTCTEGASIYYTYESEEQKLLEPRLYTEPIWIHDRNITKISAYAINDAGELPNSATVTAEYRVRNWVGIDEIAVSDAEGDTEWYNLQGVRVSAPVPGSVYVKVTGGVASKVLVK